MKLTKIIAAAAALATVVCIAGVPAQAAMTMNRYGGTAYLGKPALSVTASFVKAGGGAAHFSSVKLLNSLAGSKLAKAEVAKLTKQYGKAKVGSFVTVGDFAVKDALRLATKAGVKLPKATLSGKSLAKTLVQAGTDKDGSFVIGLMLDKAITHNIHNKVMDDVTKKFGGAADANYHKMNNQLFYDLAHAIGLKKVKLNRFH
ncbi:MAG: hypothetical protein ABI210_09445 [Abditibacteriaceae bacterium]